MELPMTNITERKTGEGKPPVLLLHGWGGGLDSLDALSAPISQHRQVWSIALPGFDPAPEPPQPWGTWEYVDFVKSWLDNKNLGKIDIIAHSFGGRVTIGLAARYPDMINRIILIASAGLIPPRKMKTQLKIACAKILSRLAQASGSHGSAAINRLKNRLGSRDWQNASPVMRGTMSRILRQDLTEELTRISAETLLIWGEKDNDTPLALAHKMKSTIPNSRLVIFKGAGHFVYLERTGEVLSEIWKHLELPSAW